MSHQVHSKKPNLPSIQFLLKGSISEEASPFISSNNDISTTASSSIVLPTPSSSTIDSTIQQNTLLQQQPANSSNRHHRHSSSISGLPAELQQLSLSAPTPNNIASSVDERSNDNRPSWMTMSPNSISVVATNTMTPTPNRRPPGANHSRSASDYSLVHSVTDLPPTVPAILKRNNYQTHRRSASASTALSLDFLNILMSNPPTTTTGGVNGCRLPHIDEQHQQQQHIRAHTGNPPLLNKSGNSFYYGLLPQERLLYDALKQPSPSTLLSSQQDDKGKGKKKKDSQHGSLQRIPPILAPSYSLIAPLPATTTKKEYENVMVARDNATGRYYCPFCNKPFNRPSSLRIHTYSHTGEKPFICPEKNCGRQFSVQSNMRRHLRVHRLDRSTTCK